MAYVNSPLGDIVMVASHQGICLLEFADCPMLNKELNSIEQYFNMAIHVGNNDHIHLAQTELTDYFAGTRSAFTVALHTFGSSFQQQAWHALLAIPYAQTCSYAEQAQYIGRPKAVRAIANANRQNRIAIIIPCHRVIGSDGQLTGYAGGLERKRWLLAHEKYNYPANY